MPNMKCTCDNPKVGFPCMCQWMKDNPGDITYGCIHCGIYEASRPRCNHCNVIQKETKMIQFTCSACGGHRLEEIMDGVTVASEVTIEDDGEVVYGEQTNDGGEILRYQCENCGKVLQKDGVTITDPEKLSEFLTTQ